MPDEEAQEQEGSWLDLDAELGGEDQEQAQEQEDQPMEVQPSGELPATDEPQPAAAGNGAAAKDDAGTKPAFMKEGLFPVLSDRAAQELSHLPLVEVDEDKTPEWEAMPHVPDEWRPLPLLLVRNIPADEGTGEADVRALVESLPELRVRSVALDARRAQGQAPVKRVAYVRLQPPPLPWELRPADEEEAAAGEGGDKPKGPRAGPPRDGDAGSFAGWAAGRLKAAQPPLELGGERLAFEAGGHQVQLYVGNLSQEWQHDAAFQEAMRQYGRLERAFVMRNAAGLSKGYGFVEFCLPAAALACKQAMDEIERRMRPDHRKPGGKPGRPGQQQQQAGAAGGGALQMGRPPSGRLIKLLRAEWASLRKVDALFSRVLYVANLRTNQASAKELEETFRQFGRIAEVTVPRNKQTQSTKGFAFVAFANGLAADRAYRALEKSGSEEIGGALVSFANPAKAADGHSRERGAGRDGAAGGKQQQQQGGQRQPGQAQQQRQRQAPLPPHGGRGSLHHGPPRRGPPDGRVGPPGMDGSPMARQQQLHMQANMAAQARLNQELEMRMAQRLQQQQAQLQAQVQAQLRQAQAQVAQAQQAAAAAQAKAAAETEARRRAEDDARRAAAASKRAQSGGGMYGGGYGGGEAGGARAGGGAGYGSRAGYGASAGFGASGGGGGGYSGRTGYGGGSSQGFGASGGQGFGSYGAAGHGSQGYTGAEYDAAGAGYGGGGDYSAGADDGGYGTAAAVGGYDDSYYGQGGGGYGDQGGTSGSAGGAYGGGGDYGFGGGADGGYGGAEVAFQQHAAHAGFGQGGSGGGYGQASGGYGQGGGGYGQGGGGYGQRNGGGGGGGGGGSRKRSAPQSQGGGYGGGYGGGGYGGMQGGGDYGKRQRF